MGDPINTTTEKKRVKRQLMKLHFSKERKQELKPKKKWSAISILWNANNISCKQFILWFYPSVMGFMHFMIVFWISKPYCGETALHNPVFKALSRYETEFTD